MKNVTPSSLNLNMDRISSASKHSSVPLKLEHSSTNNQVTSLNRTESFRSPMGDFVELDGKRYYLDAPRGTYLNILV